MNEPVILAIDQGTTNTKAVLVEPNGRIVARASIRVPLDFPAPGWVESDGRAIWATVLEAIERCMAAAGDATITAVGVTNQRESVLAWDRGTGEPLGPCVSWQCRRSTAICEDLRDRALEPTVRAKTGLGLDPMFSATKARWLLDHIDQGQARAARGKLCVGTVDSWLAWNLSGGTAFVTDLTNASRTLLLDLDKLRWDNDLLALFGVPSAALPEVRASSGQCGTTKAQGSIPGGIPIAALIGDSHAALFGHGAPPYGTVKVTYGTGSSVMMPVAARSDAEGLSSTIAWSLERPEPMGTDVVYALEGNIIATGATLAWLTDILGLADEAALGRLAAEVVDTGGVVVVPAFAGLGAPHWDAGARGLVAGLTRGSSRAHLALAAFESVGYQVRDIIEVLRVAAPERPAALVADGGAMQSDLLARLQADILGLPVLRSRSLDVAALGAAYLAGLATGTWDSPEAIRHLPRSFDTFGPTVAAEARERGYLDWRAALDRSRSRPDGARRVGKET
ncbi:MAG TPA: glycerol kinase GlpK [Coriobacteriia bacterium]|nr:glycerol kinase GlpK [Coriobacteriia bacterium]